MNQNNHINNINHKFHIISIIYIGTVFYTLASYYHLKLKESWTFTSALTIALPLVFIEYNFSLRGNYLAYSQLNLSSIDILLITMVFYFINGWLLNFFVLKHKINIIREIIAFILILLAFKITTNFK